MRADPCSWLLGLIAIARTGRRFCGTRVLEKGARVSQGDKIVKKTLGWSGVLERETEKVDRSSFSWSVTSLTSQDGVNPIGTHPILAFEKNHYKLPGGVVLPDHALDILITTVLFDGLFRKVSERVPFTRGAGGGVYHDHAAALLLVLALSRWPENVYVLVDPLKIALPLSLRPGWMSPATFRASLATKFGSLRHIRRLYHL